MDKTTVDDGIKKKKRNWTNKEWADTNVIGNTGVLLALCVDKNVVGKLDVK